ncbi:MAG TPA: glycosyltransferase family 4 protein, partial [Chitinophagaceae bacterium]|nr:glycosyltransferase family 4 protein [Chitinophagaceae bacterium]
ADLHYAVETFGLVPRRCITATYGLEWQAPPTGEARSTARERIRRLHGIAGDEHLLFFNGAFNYAPNLNALLALAEHVVPLLNRKAGFRYKILICGINIPPDISARNWPNIMVVGFVENIGDYFMAADVFLNPVIEGGGIKTKLVDALGYNCNVVSSRNGAIGVAPEWCNDKLLVTDNYDWQAFADAIPAAAALQNDIPAAFFDRFYWGNITGRVAAFLQEDYRNL